MARIPVPQFEAGPTRGLPRVNQSDGVRGIGLASAKALQDVARGISGLGQTANKIGGSLEKQYDTTEADKAAEKARQKAADAQVLDGETELHKEIGLRELGDDRQPEGAKVIDIGLDASGAPVSSTNVSVDGPTGILQKKGKSASESYADTMAALEKRQKEIAEKISSPEARAKFLRRSSVMIEDSRQRMDKHVYAQNQVALQESLGARKKELLAEAAQSPADEKRMETVEATLEGPIQSLAATPDGAEKTTAEWRQQLAETRMNALLSRGDWANAEKVLEAKRGDLGPAAAKFEAKVTQLRTKGEAGALAKDALAASVEPNGRVNIEAALSKLDATDGERYKLAAAIVGQQGGATNRQWDEVTKEYRRKAGAQFRRAGFSGIAPEVVERLDERDPDYLISLRDKELRAARSAERFRRGGEGAARRAQSDANRLAMQDYMKKPLEERLQLDVPSQYAAWDANELGVGDIEVRQRKEKDAQAKGLLVGEEAFVRRSMDKVEPFLQRKYGSGSAKEKAAFKAARDQVEARLRTEYVDHVLTTDKRPNEKEAEEIAGRARSAAVSAALSGKPAAPRPEPKPQTSAPKKPTSYRYNKTRTRRIPVYDDGTEGTAEDVK